MHKYKLRLVIEYDLSTERKLSRDVLDDMAEYAIDMIDDTMTIGILQERFTNVEPITYYAKISKRKRR